MDQDTILVITGEGETRAWGPKPLKVQELSEQLKVFLEQLGRVLEHVPEKVGQFQVEEFEVSAEITAKGTLAILGTGGEAGATSGLKFVFHRSPLSPEQSGS